jgi:hypothetical protein
LFPHAPGRSPVMVASLDRSTAAVLPVDEDARRREIRLGLSCIVNMVISFFLFLIFLL